jgi:hypothetical protein
MPSVSCVSTSAPQRFLVHIWLTLGSIYTVPLIESNVENLHEVKVARTLERAHFSSTVLKLI